jgi:hypothetical protein
MTRCVARYDQVETANHVELMPKTADHSAPIDDDDDNVDDDESRTPQAAVDDAAFIGQYACVRDATAGMPVYLRGHTATVVGAKIYVVGGDILMVRMCDVRSRVCSALQACCQAS